MKKSIPVILLIILLSCKKDQQLILLLKWCMKDSVCFVGDSQFAETGGDLVPPPRRFWQATGRTPGLVRNYAVGGWSTTQSKDNYLKRDSFLHCPVIIMSGVNNNWSDSIVIADITSIVGDNPDFLILEIPSGNFESSWPGTERYTHDSILNANIERKFGSQHFVKWVSELQKLSDGSAEDELDISRGLVPRSCLYWWYDEDKKVIVRDLLHKNNKGHQGILQAILQHLQKCNTNSKAL